jgi:hypothetical protein
MQAVTRLGELGIAGELVTLFTQTIWHVTPSKYAKNFTELVNFMIIALLVQIM